MKTEVLVYTIGGSKKPHRFDPGFMVWSETDRTMKRADALQKGERISYRASSYSDSYATVRMVRQRKVA